MRKATGWLAIIALLFAQLAVAAYACPKVAAPDASAATIHAQTPCEQLDDALSNLCQKHCHDAEQPQAAAALPPAFAPAFVVQLDPSALEVSLTRLEQHVLLRVHSPPLTIRNCCLRV